MEFKCKKIEGLGERIRDARENLKLSRAFVCEKLNIATSTLQAWESNDREPPASDIVALAELFNISTDYLLHGKYESQHKKNHYLMEASSVYKTSQDINIDDFVEIDDFRDIKVAAGFGAFNEELEANKTKVEKAWLQARNLKAKYCAMFTVDGESMYPTLKDGEKIIVDRSKRELREGKMFILNNQGALLVKKVQIGFNGVDLISDNPTYKPITLNQDEANSLIVIGQVVRGYRDF